MQEKLQDVAERSIALMANVFTRLPPSYRRPLSPLYMVNDACPGASPAMFSIFPSII